MHSQSNFTIHRAKKTSCWLTRSDKPAHDTFNTVINKSAAGMCDSIYNTELDRF